MRDKMVGGRKMDLFLDMTIFGHEALTCGSHLATTEEVRQLEATILWTEEQKDENNA